MIESLLRNLNQSFHALGSPHNKNLSLADPPVIAVSDIYLHKRGALIHFELVDRPPCHCY